ncbi:biotin--[acetyl-CoA-carboxylase] ligase [Solibacillus kalamii]|uniref:Bifunctional ligase/repressor BirA n=2 Tax=Bacteria TaxID=2 RepID=A0ABX3ZDS9_9BACL|nr:biotin--[acetyl-CoA-carboxylase] ligase [Solibacillus kalamii]OUZ37857.1 biotin--[acetyl-CoA-carboxylase] ligase [Solibacillus kalamii]
MHFTMKDEILKRFLTAEGEPISGQVLADELNVSRTAIWKHMQTLKQEGYEFETVKKRGYKLLSVPDKVDMGQLQQFLTTERYGRQVHYYETVESTQLVAHELIRAGAPDGTVVIAEHQTAGRGRMMREWESTEGQGIWMTVIIRPDVAPHQAPQFTLVTAVAIVEAMKSSFKNFTPEIKWPNDILINGKKTTGILTEMVAEADRIQALLIGIGINVNQKIDDFPEQLQTIATSIAIEEGEPVERVHFVANVLESLEKYSDEYVKNGFGQIKQLWEQSSGTIGKRVKATTLREVVEGEAVSITESGVLEIRQANGEIKGIYSADIELLP